MKTRITDALFVALIAAALIWSCSKTTIIDMREEPKQEVYTPRTKADSTEVEDTSRIPISFNVTVEGWKDVERN